MNHVVMTQTRKKGPRTEREWIIEDLHLVENANHITKSKVESLNTLLMMGFDKTESIKAVQKANTIGQAIDILNDKTSLTKHQSGDLLNFLKTGRKKETFSSLQFMI